MNSFSDAEQATAYVVAKIFEQATCEGVELTDTERKLLSGLLSEEEEEAFDESEEHSEQFWKKIALLVRHGLRDEKVRGGSPAQQAYKDALRIAATHPCYLAEILQLEGLAPFELASKIKSGYRRWLVLSVISVFGGIALAVGMMLIVPFIDRLGRSDTASRYAFIALLAAPTFIYVVVTIWTKKVRSSRSEEEH